MSSQKKGLFMLRHNDELYIHHIQEATRKIIQRLQGITRAAFDANVEKQEALFVRWKLLAKLQAKCLRPFATVIPASIGRA